MDRNLAQVVADLPQIVALRKESVDRNFAVGKTCAVNNGSLSARRAWIEMANAYMETVTGFCRSPQGERG